MAGNCKMASALEEEKYWSAAASTQPRVLQMFVDSQGDGNVARHLHAEHVFRVGKVTPGAYGGARSGRSCTLDKFQSRSTISRPVGNDAGFFRQSARGRLQQRFVDGIDGARHRSHVKPGWPARSMSKTSRSAV